MFLRWLAGNSHKLAKYNWSVSSMGRAINLLEARMESVVEEGALLLEESFAMAIFRTLELELPPLAEYLSYMYLAKRMQLAGSSVREFQYARLRAELFSPQIEANQETAEPCAELAV
eukprot:6189637-Pleurochrysis_carterae.AAC.1